MSIIGFVPSPADAATVVGWVRALAAQEEETHYLCLETGFDGDTERAVIEALGEGGQGAATVVPVDDPMPVTVVLDRVRKRGTRLLVTAPFTLPNVSGRKQTSDELLRAAPCQMFIPLYGMKVPAEVKRILFVVTGGAHDRAALRLVETMRQRFNAAVTVGGIEDETGALEGVTGASEIRALIHDAVLDPANFEVKVVTDRLKHRGIIELFDDHDLVVIGQDGLGHVRPLEQSLGDASVVVMKRTPPLRQGSLAEWLPRINPADHADLLYNLRSGSTWGADFVGMLGLAAAIASLGLLQNSPAVVIGSMLLAPLMTPMIGLGLALGQAGSRLARQCGRSIVYGFLLTLTVSFLIGYVTPAGETLSNEVLARGGPNVLDLFIAVFAAAGATFAMARPNIVGAIAGVAIATALVPPVCSVGISLAHGAWGNALGATVLFSTNLVAIIVTSSFVFSMLGITSARALKRHQNTARLLRWALVVGLVVLAGPLSHTLVEQLREGKTVPLANPVTWSVRTALYERVAQDDGVEIMFMARPRAQDMVMIHIATRDELPASYADELRRVVREAMDDPEQPVSIVAVRGLWRSDVNEGENAPATE